MAASTRLDIFKTGETKRTLTLPDQDIDWSDKKDDFTENTAFNKDFETTDTEIKENGTQALGSSTNVAPSDHVHPSDTIKSDKTKIINSQTGTTYTLILSDSDKLVSMNNANANVLTIPTNASVAFPIGSNIITLQYGVGITTITGDTGVTVNGVSAGSKALSGQYEAVLMIKIDTNTWVIANK